MLGWLRTAGDVARIDQEMQRIAVNPSSFPVDLRRELARTVQNHVDRARRIGVLEKHEIQAFFDMAFELAAAIPPAVALERRRAVECAGEAGYTLIIRLIRDSEVSLEGDLVKDLYATCRRWMRHPNPEFERELQSYGEPIRPVDAEPEKDEGIELETTFDDEVFQYSSFEEWLVDFKAGAGEANSVLQENERGCLVDFMDHTPLRRAYADGVEPFQLGHEFGEQFDLATFMSRGS